MRSSIRDASLDCAACAEPPGSGRARRGGSGARCFSQDCCGSGGRGWLEIGQIVKSLLFVISHVPLICLCAGDGRVEPAKLGNARQATAEEVRAAFAIGGVPPLGHDQPLRTVVDESLGRFTTVWCAAGTPRAVFEVRLDDLLAAMPDAEVRAAGAES